MNFISIIDLQMTGLLKVKIRRIFDCLFEFAVDDFHVVFFFFFLFFFFAY